MSVYIVCMSYHQGVFTTSSTTTPYDGRADQLSTVIKQNFYSQPSQNQCALNLRCTRPRTHPSITTPSTRNLLSYLTIPSILSPSSVQASRICNYTLQWYLQTGSWPSATADACCMPSHPDEMRSTRPTCAYLF